MKTTNILKNYSHFVMKTINFYFLRVKCRHFRSVSHFLFVILICSSALKAQKDQREIFDLKPSENLHSLPLDTVFVKLGSAINNMNGTRDVDVKTAAEITLKRAKTTKNPMFVAKAHQQLANWHYLSITSENKDSIYFYDNQALQSFLQTDDKELISKAYKTVGFDLEFMQRFSEAEAQYFQGLAVAKAIGYQKGINSIHASIAALYTNTKDFDSALKYSLMVVDAYEKEENTHPLIRAMLTLSNIYVKTDQPEKALETVNKALALVPKLPMENQNSETLNVRAWRAQAYRAMKKYDEALVDFKFSWKGMQEKYGDEKANGWKGGIGSVYYLQRKYPEAIPYLKDYVEHFKDKKVYNPDELKDHYIYLANSYKALKQPDLAFKYLAEGKDIAINALQQETEALKSELRIKYETEQKDETIASQSNLIEQQKKIQLLTYAVVVLLILLLLALLFTYRNNINKNNQLQLLNKNLETTNVQLDKRNAENELLLKEIHHRVKNNLEVVSSLLALQSAQIDDPNIQTAMQASQNRVQSMGILHQKLYQSEHLAFIEMKNYFVNLSENILDSYNERERIEVEFPMENLELDVDTAVPVGLIVNELITNALKYAFPQGKMGKIKLSLREIGTNILQLSISDNGVGKIVNAMPQGSGFGTQLVSLLTTQLNGVLTQTVENGTMISIQFAKK